MPPSDFNHRTKDTAERDLARHVKKGDSEIYILAVIGLVVIVSGLMTWLHMGPVSSMPAQRPGFDNTRP